jgi:hypothetical protein
MAFTENLRVLKYLKSEMAGNELPQTDMGNVPYG